MPSTPKGWMEVSNKFEELWNFPHCLGVINHRQCVIHKCWKPTYSIDLMAVVDADYTFLVADASFQDTSSNESLFRNSVLHEQLRDRTLELPSECPLPGRDKSVPYVFISNYAIPTHSQILQPNCGTHPEESAEGALNDRLSRACLVADNALGVMSSRFRVLRRPLLMQHNKARDIIMSCVYLHNFLRRSETSRNLYTPPEIFDREEGGCSVQGKWRDVDEGVDEQTSFLPPSKDVQTNSQPFNENRQEFAEYLTRDVDEGVDEQTSFFPPSKDVQTNSQPCNENRQGFAEYLTRDVYEGVDEQTSFFLSSEDVQTNSQPCNENMQEFAEYLTRDVDEGVDEQTSFFPPSIDVQTNSQPCNENSQEFA